MTSSPFAPAALGASALAAALLAFNPPARASEQDAPHPFVPPQGPDGVYGRLDGRLALAAGLGAELEAGEPRGALRLSAYYLWTAGIYARYANALGGAEQRAERVASFGVELRPLFLPRFGLDLEQGPALLDLTLDSLSLSSGAYFAEPRAGTLSDERGFELGLGFGVPLSGSARGVWLDARAERRFADRGQSAWLWTLGVSFQAITWSTEAEAR